MTKKNSKPWIIKLACPFCNEVILNLPGMCVFMDASFVGWHTYTLFPGFCFKICLLPLNLLSDYIIKLVPSVQAPRGLRLFFMP